MDIKRKKSMGMIAAGVVAVFIFGIYSFVGNQMDGSGDNDSTDISPQEGQEGDTTKPLDQSTTSQDGDASTEQIKRICGTEESAKSNTYVTEYKIPTSCSQPRAIDVAPSGEVWFAKTMTGSLVKFNPQTGEFTEYENPNWPEGHRSQISGLAYSQSADSLFFTDEVHDSIWRFSVENKEYSSFKFPESSSPENKTQMTYPQKIILTENTAKDETDASMIVNDLLGGKITVFDNIHADGQEGISYTNYERDFFSQGVTAKPLLDKDEKIWYTTWEYRAGGGKLVKLEPDTGAYDTFDLPEDVLAPNGMSMDSEGSIWITDAGSSLFLKFDPMKGEFTKYTTNTPRAESYGNSTGVIRTPISRPYWNDIDTQGRVWFNEQAANAIAMFDPSAKKLVEYSIPSTNPYWADCDKNDQDCGTAQALEMAVGNNKVWFTEWVENNIGVVDPSVPLPFDITVVPKKITFDSKKGEGNSKTILLEITPKFDKQEKELTLVTESTFPYQTVQISSVKVKPNGETSDDVQKNESPSLKDNKILVQGGGNGHQAKTTLELTLEISNNVEKGTYHMALGARDNEITISRLVEIVVN